MIWSDLRGNSEREVPEPLVTSVQNLKAPDRDPFHIRKGIIAPPGYLLIAADYSALEMMVLAAAACEEEMLEIFRKGWDIHMGNAAMVFGLPYEDMVKAKKIDKAIKENTLPESAMTAYVKQCLDARQAVKTIGYGLNYGMKAQKLANNLGITVEEAQALMDKYMAKWKAVDRFFRQTQTDLETEGYAYTFMGRRRYLPAVRSPKAYERFRAGRQGANGKIQGTAAEIAKMAMNRLYYEGKLAAVGWRMLSQIHDELLCEGPAETVDEAKAIIKEAMENPFGTPFPAPLQASPASGESWLNCK